jgi:SAM-dependent methyltransferase
MKTSTEIKETVKAKYNAIAEENTSCCGDSCGVVSIGESYDNLEGHVDDADLNLGCGLPTEYAGIKEGDTVVDLGSGAGNDAFIARAIVGESGRVIGVDMADVMHQRAIDNARKLGYDNVEFKLGEIENIPLPDETANVVVSNCVFNLVPSKKGAFDETFRILKPGAHFSIADVVIRGNLPPQLREQAELYVGCVSGAIDKDEYLEIVRNAGFEDVKVVKEREIKLTEELLDAYLNDEEKALIKSSQIGIYSITVNATKPGGVCCAPDCC